MTLITIQDGKIVVRDGRVGTEQACCCGDQGPCAYFVEIYWIGVQVGLNQCAKCWLYPGDLASTVAGLNSLRDAVRAIFEARGFTVRYEKDFNCITQTITDVDDPAGCEECEVFPCDVEWCGEDFGGLCLDCDGTAEEDFTLDPLPTEFSNTAPDPCGVVHENEFFAALAFDAPGSADYLVCNPLP
jgi:hypothetical protein